jgi:fatty acid desaturase
MNLDVPAADAAAPRKVEAPTLVVAAAIYGGWLAATYWHDAIPVPLLAVAGGWLIAWHGSLQHETIHGHPTGSRRVNAAIGFPPLALWLPYAIYARSHVAHHRSPAISDPLHDPESRYVTHARGVAGMAARAQATLLGRLLLGPPIAVLTLLVEERLRARRAPVAVLRDWVPHFLAVALVAEWLAWARFGIGHYILLFVYPGMALTLLRSFAEHRADLSAPGRAATVERARILGLLYLNNNLHAAHHDRPDLAWYRLPAHYRTNRARLTGDARPAYPTYGAIARAFFLKRHDMLVHPAHRDAAP